MSSIAVNSIAKKYKRYPSNWARLAEWLTLGRHSKHEDRWALRGLTFSVEPGEAVGIIGQNGAGKSTLLKILTGTTQPTEGGIKIEGRVAALLELGMGFHHDFTGRENAIMACQMAGIDGEELQALLPQIEEFSELGDYIDQPLRVYSTGMQMRLAFSAATAIRPDILIVDEALSVGDLYFQHKCINRIRFFKEQGTTLLFVSHDPGAVKSLCDRALLLDEGVLIKDESPDTVLDYYNAMIAKKTKDEEIQQVETELGKTSTRSGSGKVRVVEVNMFDARGKQARAFRVGELAEIRCDVTFNTSVDNPTIGILIRDRLGNDVFGTNTYHMKVGKHSYKEGESTTVVFSLPINLGPGNYSLTIAVHSYDTHLKDNYDWWDQCLAFQVVPNDSFSFIGLAALPVDVKIQRS